MYRSKADTIILIIDISLKGWGAILIQIREAKRHSARYKSGVWNITEAAYDVIKQEYYEILFTLKCLQYYLYRIYFVLEIDTLVLAQQLNRLISDLSGALFIKQITWIRTFNFKIKHVRRIKNIITNILSYMLFTNQDRIKQKAKEDIKEFIDT